MTTVMNIDAVLAKNEMRLDEIDYGNKYYRSKFIRTKS